jgi:hypothetical protein
MTLMKADWIARASIAGMALFVGAATLAQDLANSGSQPQTALSRWAVHDPRSGTRINYDPLDQLLTAFVAQRTRSETMIPFVRLKGEGQRIIRSFLGDLQKVEVDKLARDEQLAFWLNLRTLALLEQTIESFPARDPRSLFLGETAITARRIVTVGGQQLSIGDIDRIILTNWREPHVVYGLTLPVRGAPAMPRMAYRGAAVHSTLERAGRDFVNRGGVVRPKGASVELSGFFSLHPAAMGNEAMMIDHIRLLAAPKLAERMAGSPVISSRFDWALATVVERSSFDQALVRSEPYGSGRDSGGPSAGS